MNYVSLYIVNVGGRSGKRYTFHTKSEPISADDKFMVQTKHGVQIANDPIVVPKPSFETNRAIRITQELFERAYIMES